MEGGSIWEGGESSPALAKCFLDNLSLQPFRKHTVCSFTFRLRNVTPPSTRSKSARGRNGVRDRNAKNELNAWNYSVCVHLFLNFHGCLCASLCLLTSLYVCVSVHVYACLWECLCLHACLCVVVWGGRGRGVIDHVSASDPPSQISVVTFQTRTHRETGHFLLKAPRAPTRLYRSISYFVSIES